MLCGRQIKPPRPSALGLRPEPPDSSRSPLFPSSFIVFKGFSAVAALKTGCREMQGFSFPLVWGYQSSRCPSGLKTRGALVLDILRENLMGRNQLLTDELLGLSMGLIPVRVFSFPLQEFPF